MNANKIFQNPQIEILFLHFRRDLIRSGLARKKECEHRAVEIVQRLAGAHEDSPQPRIDPDWLESCSRMLTPSHYSDAVHERAAAGLCGLPVCPVEGGGRVDPKEAFQDRGKFRIDSRNNRVYDVTERKVGGGDCSMLG